MQLITEDLSYIEKLPEGCQRGCQGHSCEDSKSAWVQVSSLHCEGDEGDSYQRIPGQAK